jgi:hypothetical protein
VKLLLVGLTIAVAVYLATSEHVLFLPLILFLPVGFLFRARKPGSSRRSRNWP